jgi:DNA-binding IclR family transcriptional regulator
MPLLKGARTGIQSIEVGSSLLQVLTNASGPMTLTGLAAAAGMTPSKAHKYLASFMRVGLVRQSAETGRYDLGPLAVEMSFAALRRLNVVEFAQDTLHELRDELDLTAVLTVWANRGPTIVRRADNNREVVSLVVQLGFVLPVLTSSNGRIFATYLDPRVVRPLIEAELADPNGLAARAGLRTMADVEALRATVRQHGLADAAGLFYPGVTSVSSPVFDHSNSLVAALTLVGPLGLVDLSWQSHPADVLKAAAKALSRRLGAAGVVAHDEAVLLRTVAPANQDSPGYR